MTLAEFYATHGSPRAIVLPCAPAEKLTEKHVLFAPALYGAAFGEACGAFLIDEPETESE